MPEEGEMNRGVSRHLGPLCQAVIVLIIPFVAHASPPRAAAAEGIPATVVTIKGESIEGRFLGATGAELTIDVGSRIMTLTLRDVSYVSFVGRPVSAEAVTYATKASPSSQLRMEGSVHETGGRLSEALRKYEEAAKLDPSDPATIKALGRVRQKIQAQEAATKAARYKKLAVELKETRRYAEAAACYDEAVRLDPYDQAFRESLAALRHYWEPTTCPVGAAER